MEYFNQIFIFKQKGEQCRGPLHGIPVDVDLVAVALGFERLGQHQLAHPVDALVPRLHCEVVRLAVRHDPPRGPPVLLDRACGHELEAEGRGVVFFGAGGELERLELGGEFVGGDGGAGDGVVVDVDGVEGGGRREFVGVHGEPSAGEAEVMVFPFVAQELGASFLHPPGVVNAIVLEASFLFGSFSDFGGGGVGGVVGALM